MPLGWLMPVPVKLVTAPLVVSRPIVLLALMNQSAPSDPHTIPDGDDREFAATIEMVPADGPAANAGTTAAVPSNDPNRPTTKTVPKRRRHRPPNPPTGRVLRPATHSAVTIKAPSRSRPCHT